MEAIRGLKAFSNVCPFLRNSSIGGLRSLSLTPNGGIGGSNRLAHLAQTGCPLMSLAYAAKGYSTNATSTIKPLSNTNTTTTTKTGGNATQTRGYASIAEQQAESLRLQRQATAAKITSSILSSSTKTSSSTSTVAGEAEDSPSREFFGGRPTNALGFAKHTVTSARPGFDYEDFYNSELAKKHQDKSYRVRLLFPFEARARS